MKIIIFKAYYEPEKAASLYLTNNLLEDLSKCGYKIDLHVPIPTRNVSNELRKKYKKNKIETLYGENLKIYRYYLPKEYPSTILRATRYIISNFIYLFKGILTKNIDLIHVTSTPPTMGLVAAVLKKFKNVPVVYTLQDIFPDSLLSTGIAKKGSIFWRVGRVIETYSYKHADKIIVISQDFKRNIMAKGVPEEKIEVIYNWVEENVVVPIERSENILIDRFNLSKEPFYIVYAGNLGFAQNIEIILEVAQELIDIDDIQFIIFGNGNLEDSYKEMAIHRKLSNTRFFPLQPYSDVSYVYSLGDVSIVSCKEGFGKSAMPSKTWSILSAGRAVIANFDQGSELQQLLSENNIGIFTKAGDINEFKNAILKLYYNRDECEKMGVRGREFILNNLTRNIGTTKYINIINSLIGGQQNV